MNPTDAKILEFLEILKSNGTIRFDIDFCRAIGLKKQNLNNIKNGVNHFTPEHIKMIVKEFNADANWIFNAGLKPFRK